MSNKAKTKNQIVCQNCGDSQPVDALYYITPCSNCGASGKFKKPVDDLWYISNCSICWASPKSRKKDKTLGLDNSKPLPR